MDSRLNPSGWTVGLAASVLAAAGAVYLPPSWSGWLAPVAGGAALLLAAAWYWQGEVRAQPEALPKLRVAAAAVLLMALSLLNALALQSLGLAFDVGPGINPVFGFLATLTIPVAAACLAVDLTVVMDLVMLRRRRWSWPLMVALVLVVASLVIATVTTAGFLVLAALILALTTPMEWLFTLEARERRLFLAGGFLALLPLAAGVWTGSFVDLPRQRFLIGFIELGSIICVTYLLPFLVRATLSTPGARAYEQKAQELSAVYDFSLSARTAFDPKEFSSAVLRTLVRIVEPDVAALIEPEPEGPRCRCTLLRTAQGEDRTYEFRGRATWESVAEQFQDRRPLEIVDHGRTRFDALKGMWEPGEGSSVLVPVLSRDGEPRALLMAGRFVAHGFTNEEVRSLAGFSSQVGLAIEHARLLREVVESERRKRELEIARELQLNLLPKSPPVIDGLEIADRSIPATEVGGDYFDYLASTDGRLDLVVGDVSGHGMPAGLMMAMVKSAIHTQNRPGITAEQMMERLDEMLLDLSAENQFMTLVFARFDVSGRRLVYVNAGHHFPLHYRAATGDVDRLESTSIPLGMMDRPHGTPVERQLGAGDILAFYSDGLIEAFDAGEEQFGIDRLARIVSRTASQPAERIVRGVFGAVDRFRGDVHYHDDATLVIVKVS